MLCFCQPPRLFQPSRLLTLEIFANLPIYCTRPVYYFGRNLPASPFIRPYPSIWNSRVYGLERRVYYGWIDWETLTVAKLNVFVCDFSYFSIAINLLLNLNFCTRKKITNMYVEAQQNCLRYKFTYIWQWINLHIFYGVFHNKKSRWKKITMKNEPLQ